MFQVSALFQTRNLYAVARLHLYQRLIMECQPSLRAPTSAERRRIYVNMLSDVATRKHELLQLRVSVVVQTRRDFGKRDQLNDRVASWQRMKE